MRWIVLPLLLTLAPVQALNAEHSDRMSYMLVNSDGSSTGSGSTEDFERVNAMRKGAPMLYFRDGGAAYVIRDPATLHQAEIILEPQRRLGERQGELGEAQGKLGAAQGALGAEQGKLGAIMADSTPRQMEALGEQQASLGRQQSALGAKQAELGAKQAELGHRQEREAELAQAKLRALAAQAIKQGLAQRVQ